MRNCIKTLLLSTIVLLMSNNNCYSENGDFENFNEYLANNINEDCRISDKNIKNIISEIEDVAQQAFYGNQIASRSYAKLLCYFKLMSKCENHSSGKYAMLHIVKKACNEFLDKKDLVELNELIRDPNTYAQAKFKNQGVKTDNEKLHDLYSLIDSFSTYAQMKINEIQAYHPDFNTDKGKKSLEDSIDKKVAEAMEVWDKCHK